MYQTLVTETKEKGTYKLGMVAHTCTQEVEAGGS
jgi:hypothetical protein